MVETARMQQLIRGSRIGNNYLVFLGKNFICLTIENVENWLLLTDEPVEFEE